MAAVKELLRSEADGGISFGDYELAAKTKLKDFNHQGDLYKVKTFREITKLERNDLFVYESVPGTAVEHFRATAEQVEFQVSGPEDAQITLGLEDETEYRVYVDGEDVGIHYGLAPVKFDRIRRITGYLVGTLDRFNDAKRAEEHDRVKHEVPSCCIK